MQEIIEPIGDYLTPTQAYSSETTNEVYEATTRKNRGKEKLLSWTGVQHCAASTLWWADVGTREEQSMYWAFKELESISFDTGFRICRDLECTGDPIAAGDSSEPYSYVLADW